MAASTPPPPPLAEEEAGTEAPPAGVPPLVVLYLDWCKPVCTAAYAKTVLALVGELAAMARAGTGAPLLVVCGGGQGWARAPEGVQAVMEALLAGGPAEEGAGEGSGGGVAAAAAMG